MIRLYLLPKSDFLLFLSLLVICLLSGCEKDLPVQQGECFNIPPSDHAFGYERKGPSLNYANPCFNPHDNNQIVVIRVRNNPSLIKYNLKTNETTQVFDGTVYYQPDWGANGWITFNSVNNQIWIVRPDGSGLKKITDDKHWYLYPKWVTNSNKILFRQKDETPYPELRIIDKGGSLNAILDSTFGWVAVWSPDGQTIAFPYGQRFGYVNLKSDSQTIHYIESDYQMKRGFSPYSISWFPNSEQLVTCDRDGNMYMVNIQSESIQKIKNACDSKSYSYPSVSPDGNKIIIKRTDKKLTGENTLYSASKIVLMNADGSNERVILPEEE